MKFEPLKDGVPSSGAYKWEVERTDLRIVLERDGSEAPPIEIRGSLWHEESGTVEYYVFAAQSDSATQHCRYRLTGFSGEAATVRKLTVHGIACFGEMVGDRFVCVAEANIELVRKVTFMMLSKDDGFVEYRPAGRPDDFVQVLRQMKEAPLDGYEQQLVYPGIGDAAAPHPHVYAFVRMAGLYGKVHIVPSRFGSHIGDKGPVRTVGASLELEIQCNGTRELRSMR